MEDKASWWSGIWIWICSRVREPIISIQPLASLSLDHKSSQCHSLRSEEHKLPVGKSQRPHNKERDVFFLNINCQFKLENNFWGRRWGRCIQDLGEMPKRKLDFISEFSVIKCMRYGQMPNNGCINPNEGWLVNLKDQKCLFYISCLFGCFGRRGRTWVGWQRKSYMGLHFYISCRYMGQRGLGTILHFACV